MRLGTYLMLCVAVTVMTGCRKTPTTDPGADVTPPAETTMVSPVHDVVTTAGGFTLEVRFHPDPIPLNEAFDLTVDVKRDGHVVENVTLAVDARMPEHRHGMTRAPSVTHGGGSTFDAAGFLFHMPGYWELYLDVTDHRGITERAQMEITLE